MIMELVATADAPAQARAAVNASLRGDPRADAALLATSEVVTNALLHGRLSREDVIELRLSDDGDRLRVEVLNRAAIGFSLDEATALHDGAAVENSSVGGWGLDIVGAVSSRWGVQRDGGRTLVWFEV
ncbi:ATP-binding protein [Conexibacter stalactiti]|uniref:ATP-binding protein n=1 Tax=Conexibacter stalactiti TaxID=1940611 RepID=A0ABU4HL15_9ACTN|nr:ATP-binding protein [Conexibacter stalactiti]MDW5593392.1 ATP-binding protein [Conexibacter stalactiti]MEC5034033.1 ATP-binding protein [Conexibacter stalactiti]